MRIERVIEKRRALQNLFVIPADVGESLADGPKPSRFWCDADLLGKIGSVDDQGEPGERRVPGKALGDELLEGTETLLIFVRIYGSRRIETESSVARLDAGDLMGLDENNLRLKIKESLDQPAGRRALAVNGYPHAPFHRNATAVY